MMLLCWLSDFLRLLHAKIIKFYLMKKKAFLKALMEGVVSLYSVHIETKSLTLKMG